MTSIWRSVLLGGLTAGILDAIDALVAFKLVLGMNPVPIYQFVASGILGKPAYAGGLVTAGLGLGIHFCIAFTAAAIYNLAAMRVTPVGRYGTASGLAFGVGVYGVMNYIVIPLSAIGAVPWSLPLFINGIVGHALLVGLPIAWTHSAILSNGNSPPAVVHRGCRCA